MFYELRQYKVFDGKMDAFVEVMESEIIPFQVGKGMVICASFQGEEDDSVYFCIRRFENEADRGDKSYLLQETYIVGDSSTNTSNIDKTAQNELFDQLDDNVLDFSEKNPFGDAGSSN